LDVRQNQYVRWAFVVVVLTVVEGCGRSADTVDAVAETTSDCPAATSWTRISSDAMTAAEVRNAVEARLHDYGITDRCSFAMREADGYVEFSAGDIADLVYQRQLAIMMDGQVLSAPTIQMRTFGGRAEISGGFSASEAKALASALSHPLVGKITVEPAPGSSSNS
jgi:preprotein translocase subunit SecD